MFLIDVIKFVYETQYRSKAICPMLYFHNLSDITGVNINVAIHFHGDLSHVLWQAIAKMLINVYRIWHKN